MIPDLTLIIAMSVTFILVFAFVKTIDKRKWLTFLVSLALAPVIYFYVVYPMINIFSNYHHKKYFSSEIWKEKPALRYELSDDMIDSNILIGKSKTEVNTLLGKEEWFSWDDQKKAHDTNRWNYSMGQEPGAFNEHKECIEIVFQNDKVVEIQQYQQEIIFDENE